MCKYLFKGKRKDNNEWVEGFLLKECNHSTCSWNLGIEYKTERSGVFAYNVAEIIPETVGQYTGLTTYWHEFDNEPQEADVWEHDLLEVDYEDKKVIATVKYEAGMFILCSPKFADGYIPLFDKVITEDEHYMNAKKIGNIHDNPQLLEEK